jgi:hypothetical protein
MNCRRQVLQDLTVYNFIYSAVVEKPEVRDKLLKRMVGASGLACPERSRREPPISLGGTPNQIPGLAEPYGIPLILSEWR